MWKKPEVEQTWCFPVVPSSWPPSALFPPAIGSSYPPTSLFLLPFGHFSSSFLPLLGSFLFVHLLPFPPELSDIAAALLVTGLIFMLVKNYFI